MHIKVFDLNLWQGAYVDAVISFLKTYQPDVVLLQEVGRKKDGSFDAFRMLQEQLGYKGETYIASHLYEDESIEYGNAVLYKPSYQLLKKEIIWLKHPSDKKNNSREETVRYVLSLLLRISSKDIYCIATHLAWGPTPKDTDYKLEQGQKLIEYVKSLDKPFLLGGDFNLSRDSKIVNALEQYGVNLQKKYHITNTLNGRVHKAPHLFPPGLAVDYIFVHPSLSVSAFRVLADKDLSDHLALTATIDI